MCRFFFHEPVLLAGVNRAMPALAGAGAGRRRSFHPQAWFKPRPISGLCLLLTRSRADGVGPRGSLPGQRSPRHPQLPALFSVVSSGSQMGAQNASAQPSLRLSACCLLLPGRCDPAAELRAEPLVRS